MTRLNFSELYQHLNAASLLEQMVERHLILPKIKGDAENYSNNYAKNILATVGLFPTRNSPPTFLLDLCETLEGTGTCQQRSLAAKLRSGKSLYLYMCRYHYLYPADHNRFYWNTSAHGHPQYTLTIVDFSDLQSQFLQMLQVVIESFNQLSNSLIYLKQFLRQLVLPLGEGKTVPLLDPSRYENAVTTRDFFRQQSVHWNSFSPDLLKMLCEECQCSPAMAAVEQFIQFRSKFANSLICQQTIALDKASTPTSTSSCFLVHLSHLTYHTGPINDLQSLHPSVFQCLDEHSGVEPQETIRLTVQVNRTHLTLQDYDDITTAMCGYFCIPKAALVYGGCSDDGQVVCWTMSASLLPYLKNVNPGISAGRLMAEERILGIAAGDLQYRCMGMKVCNQVLSEDITVFYIFILSLTTYM